MLCMTHQLEKGPLYNQKTWNRRSTSYNFYFSKYCVTVAVLSPSDMNQKHDIQEFLDSGRKSWKLDSGRWALDAGLWTLDYRCSESSVQLLRPESMNSGMPKNILWKRMQPEVFLFETLDSMRGMQWTKYILKTWHFLDIL